MQQLAFISYTSAAGQSDAVCASEILYVRESPSGSILTLRSGPPIAVQESVATIIAAIQLVLATAAGITTTYNVAAYAVGTAYSLTNTAAALDFGTTDPAIVIAQAGTYLIRGRVLIKYNAATFAANRTVTLKFRRTNNTAADLTNGSTAPTTDIITLITGTWLECQLPEVVYSTTATTDSITIFGSVDVVPSAGSLDATEAHILAQRIA